MSSEKIPQEKSGLHPRNRNRYRYDLDALIISIPELKSHVKINKFGLESLDFSNSLAVKLLNKAILKHYYGISYWEFPDDNLCPPIPGRADYIHYMADLLAESNLSSVPMGNKITCLDIGVGASCIYPIIGVTEYGWKFIGAETDAGSLESGQKIADSNPALKTNIELRLQKNRKNMFQGIIGKDEKIDLSICNPPFHATLEEAQKGSLRKIKNLSGKDLKTPELNFAGSNAELIYEGGEAGFIRKMIVESKQFSRNCMWFSTLVSKESNLRGIYMQLEDTGASQVKTISMETSNKTSRLLAWTFLSKAEQKEWSLRWKQNL